MGAREREGVQGDPRFGAWTTGKVVATYRVGTNSVGAASVEGRTRSSLLGTSCSKCETGSDAAIGQQESGVQRVMGIERTSGSH